MGQKVYFDNIKDRIIENLNSCKFELKIAVAWFTDKKIIEEVNKLIQNGVDVEIIIYDDVINKKDLYKDLYYSKVNIWLSKRMMHNKFCIIDNDIVINGSYNWTNQAARNHENIQISYDNKELSEQFIRQFEELKESCTKIDDYFDYSLSSLSDLEEYFDSYYAGWESEYYRFPYFIDASNIQPSKPNKYLRFKGEVYFITNEEEERKFVFFLWLIETDHSVSKILQIQKTKVVKPRSFDFVHNLVLDKNNVGRFLDSEYIVERKRVVYKIDSAGNIISEKFPFSHKFSNELYLYSTTSPHSNLSPHFFNKRFEKTLIPHSVYSVCGNYIIVRKYGKKRFDLGVLDLRNKLVIPFLYDKYGGTHDDPNISLIEYPIFNRKINTDWLEISNHSYNNYLDADHIIHIFSVKTLKLLEQKRIKGTKGTETDDFIFLSEENYKYKSFYELIRENGLDGALYGNSCRRSYFKVKEFDTMKRDFNNPAKIQFYLRKFKNERENERRLKAEESKKFKGCYIATMVYQNYDHPNVILLREFRDQKLNKNYLGKMFINIYYIYSPRYVEFVKDKVLLRKLSYGVVELVVRILKKTWRNKV